jgi:DNA-binding transcriptional ArsR family regulator
MAQVNGFDSLVAQVMGLGEKKLPAPAKRGAQQLLLARLRDVGAATSFELASAAQVEPKQVSSLLHRLVKAGVVERRKDGRWLSWHWKGDGRSYWATTREEPISDKLVSAIQELRAAGYLVVEPRVWP